MGAALDWLKKEYGYNILETESTPVTSAVPVEVIQNDPDAVSVTFINFGGQDIFLSLRQNAPASSGIRIVANGGSFSLNLRDDLTLPARSWYATSPGGASSLYILRLRGETRAAV